MGQSLSIVLLLILTGSNVYGQSNEELAAKAKRLKIAFDNVNRSADKAHAEIEYFKQFPNTFYELKAVYGFNNDTAALLYSEDYKHLEVFNNLTSVNDTLYYQKIIAIAIGGKWDADAVGYFQEGLQKRINHKPALACYLLKKLPENDTRSFWYFYFDSPHPNENLEPSIISIEHIDTAIFRYLKEEHKKVLADWREH